MSKILGVASVVFLTCVSHAGWGATWYVDGSVSASGDATSWEMAFKTIQEGIDAALIGERVVVWPGAISCESQQVGH